MTRRRTTVNIYDYPEHLNPFREDADDNGEKFNTTGRRRSSFRVNAWSMFSPSKGKLKTSEDVNPPSQSTTSRFMTWTPKLLRRASFRRNSNSPPCSSSSPREPVSPSSSRLSFRTTSSRSSLPPSGSSRTSLPPPSSSPQHPISPSRPTSPPSRPAPPNVRPPLSPSRPLSPPITANGHTAANTETTPVPPLRRALYTASPTKNKAGEQPAEDEVKYVQQGAKPKKKRRAPLPPQPSPSKSPGDSRQLNSNESDTSLASSATEEPTSQSTAASPDLEVRAEEPMILPKTEEKTAELPEREENVKTAENGEQKTSESPEESDKSCENQDGESPVQTSSDQQLQNGHSEESSKIEDHDTGPKDLEAERENEIPEKNDKEAPEEREETVVKIVKEVEVIENVQANGVSDHKDSDHLQVDFNVVLHISEEDLRDNPPKTEENHSVNHQADNGEHIKENGVTKLDDCEKSSPEIREEKSELKLHNGGNESLSEREVSLNEEKKNLENKKQVPNDTPAPKPRTILPNTLKD